MEQYISKSTLVVKIKARISDIEVSHKAGLIKKGDADKKILLFKSVLSLIDTLEVKEVQEEPVSEDLEEASKEWLRPQLDKSYVNYGEVKMMELTHFDGYAMLDAIEFGAKWKEQQLMSKDIDASCFDRFQGSALFSFRLPTDKYLVGSDVKVIVIKED